MSFHTRKLKEERPPHPLVLAMLRGARMVLRLGGPIGDWYAHFRVRQEESDKEKKRLHFLKKAFALLASVLLALLIVAGIVKALVSAQILSLHTAFNVVGTALPQDEHGFTNILLLGKGDDAHEGTDLTDSMMIVSLDPHDTRSAVIISIPRDLYILDPQNGLKGRVNQLYRDYRVILKRKGVEWKATEAESLKMVMAELSHQFGLPIHEAVMVNFSAFTKVVDEMGGVDVVVPSDLVDTEYPNPAEDGYITFAIKAGPQHLDGDTALKYARSRHSTSDFDRSARQQQVISALQEQAKTAGLLTNPAKLIALWNIVSKNTITTMSLGQLLGFADMATRIEKSNLISAQLNNQTGYDGLPPAPGGLLYNPPREQFDGASVLLPVSLPQFPVTYRHIQLYVQLLTEHRELYLAPPSIAILNASGRSGLASKLAYEFTRFGIHIEDTGNAPGPKRDTSVISARSPADLPMATFFGTMLKLPVEVQPPEAPTEGVPLISIILGKDYTYTPLTFLIPAKAESSSSSEEASSSSSLPSSSSSSLSSSSEASSSSSLESSSSVSSS